MQHVYLAHRAIMPRCGRRAFGRRAFGSLVHSKIAEALRTRLDIISPNQIQAEALKVAIARQTLLCVAQTGSGKTLVALLPILERLAASQSSGASRSDSALAPDALMIAPAAVLAAQHIAIARTIADGLPTPPTIASACQAPRPCDSNGLLVISTPSQVLRRITDGTLDLSRTHTVAIDEVDAVLCSSSPYDDSLSAEGAALLATIDAHTSSAASSTTHPPSLIQYLLTTAVLTLAHERALLNAFSVHGVQHVRQLAAGGGGAGALVPSLRQRFHYVARSKKDAQLLRVLDAASADDWLANGAALVFCRTADDAKRVAALIAARSAPAGEGDGGAGGGSWGTPLALHDELDTAERDAALDAIRTRTSSLLVCTGLAARGLDLADLRHVILYDVPSDVAGYVHAAGRTARRGRDGLVTCLAESRTQAGEYRQLHALQQAPRLRFAEQGGE